jgi:uncharacterized protein
VAPFTTRVLVLVGIALFMTVGVYGLVAGIVKLDDGGLCLSRRPSDGFVGGALRPLSRAILCAAPWLLRGLSVAGTAAMLLVGGAIIVHGIPPLHQAIEHVAQATGWFAWPSATLAEALVGIAAGALALVVVSVTQRASRPRAA